MGTGRPDIRARKEAAVTPARQGMLTVLASSVIATMVCVATAPAHAREEIRSFTADISLARDGSVRAVETIDVNSESSSIRRGIIREIPLAGSDSLGGRSNLQVETVMRDGAPEVFVVERDGQVERIRIGDESRILSLGLHRYALTYRMANAVRRFDDHDEILWNVIGSGWSFPILTAMANVSLPDGAEIASATGFIGAPGPGEQALRIVWHRPTMASFQSRRPLAAGEGMTVAVSFQKGIVTGAAPPRPRDLPLPLAGLVLVLAYVSGAWWIAGRQGRSPAIQPSALPPAGLSPALMAFIREGGANNTGWTPMIAAIMDMARRGLVTVGQGDRAMTISATGRPLQSPLPAAEAALLDYFASEGTVTIDGRGGGRLSWQRAKFMKRLAEDNRGIWFRRNGRLVLFAFMLIASVIGAMAWSGAIDDDGLIGIAIGTVLLGMFGMMAPNFLRRRGVRRTIFTGVGVGMMLTVAAAAFPERMGSSAGVMVAGILVLLAYAFAMIMPGPTERGRAALAQIEGFRRYLEGQARPEDEPAFGSRRFEDVFPYAVALGLERSWSQRLNAALVRDAASAADWERYDPIWYSSRPGAGPSDIADAVAAIPAAMSSAMAENQSASDGFSASDGQGSSGGETGGGGGSGW